MQVLMSHNKHSWADSVKMDGYWCGRGISRQLFGYGEGWICRELDIHKLAGRAAIGRHYLGNEDGGIGGY